MLNEISYADFIIPNKWNKKSFYINIRPNKKKMRYILLPPAEQTVWATEMKPY